MYWSSFVLAFSAVAQAMPQRGGGGGGGGFIRFGCSQVVIDRIDPLVNPDQRPSPHMHQVIGGNAFNVSIASTDVSKLATCTTCSFSEDRSNYWTANLYFKARNGTYRRIPQIPNRFLAGSQGGMTVYYVSTNAGKVTAFKPGFRMLVGDAGQRAKKGSGMKSQSCYRCYTGPNFKGDDLSPCADPRLDTEELPKGPCLGGIRSNIHFPTCWDGKNLDSPDHKSHIAYPTAGPAGFSTGGGTCPASHPVKIPQLMLEIVWDTMAFNDKSEWPADGSQPFVLSTGDHTGYGQHGDYVFGWEADSLQKAMDGGCALGGKCTLKTQAFTVANQCAVTKKVPEDVDGWFTELPGGGTGV